MFMQGDGRQDERLGLAFGSPSAGDHGGHGRGSQEEKMAPGAIHDGCVARVRFVGVGGDSDESSWQMCR
jgi:hypothetical protein